MPAIPATPILGRICVICGTELVRQPGEVPVRFNRRETCCWQHGRVLAGLRSRKGDQGTRTCAVCGQSFRQHERETPCNFHKRQTCSGVCKGQRLNRIRHERTIAKRRVLSRFVGDVPLSNGLYALVDPDDFERVMQHVWNARQAPDSDRWYVTAPIDGKRVKLHQFVMQAGNGELYDHISRDGLDNRKHNLRLATHSQNAMNRKLDRRNTSGYKGVSRNNQLNRWQAAIGLSGRKVKRIGFYDTAEEAARAYDEKARELFGEFARLNFPREGEQAA
jgi:hypothetical protein